MKIMMTIITRAETLDVHVDIEDETTAQAKLAQMLQDIQKRFCARGETKKAAPSAAPKPTRESGALAPADKS